MRKLVLILRQFGGALAGAAALCMAGAAAAAPEIPVVPAPASATSEPGSLRIADGTVVRVRANDASLRPTAAWFAELVARTRGVKLDLAAKATAPPAIVFQLAYPEAFGAEGYKLEVGPKGVTVTASSEVGLMHGASTLWQLMTADGGRGPVTLRAMTIRDSPRFAWRGLMLDSARHYQSPAYIKRLIEVMALHKLNVLHWHLTDDQAWRLEIRKYPRLTGVGAWRVPAGEARNDVDPKTGKPRLYGGFYSQAEVRDIVAYAAARHVTVVPEIEMPGHALAPILAYPELGVMPASADIQSDWGVFPNLYNVEEPTFGFIEDVLTEVMALFPGKFIHIGGDEAVKDQWKASPRVQARMRELGVRDETALQGYFTTRVARFLAAHGRRAIGWDEVLEGGLPEDAAVMSWRGPEGATIAARRGHDAVLAAWPTLYLDNRQAGSPAEPPGRGRIVGQKDVYAFEPMPTDITEAQRRHILGLQANLWTEHVRTEARAAHMTWPREAAVAEVGWSPAAARDYPGFVERLRPWMARYAALGVQASDAAFRADPPPDARVRLSQQLKTCADKLVLSLEDDAPVRGDRAVFLIDIMQPCWIWQGADLTGVGGLAVRVGQVPFNFQIGADREKIVLAKPHTPEGELEVRLDGCEGRIVASLPLKPAVANAAVTELSASIEPTAGRHDLCFAFTGKTIDPMWAIDHVELRPRGSRS